MARTRLSIADPVARPRGCPTALHASFRYYNAAHRTVEDLFETFNTMREVGDEADPRGRLSNHLEDQLRASIVFTSAGLDATMARLCADAVALLVGCNRLAEQAFKKWVSSNLDDRVGKDFRKAILELDPRAAMLALYPSALTKASLQNRASLIRIRDALGISSEDLPDGELATMDSFFKARNDIVHSLDLMPEAQQGVRSQRPRRMAQTKDSCNAVFALVGKILVLTADNLKAVR